MVPLVIDITLNQRKGSIVMVISPLISPIKNKVQRCKEMGFNAASFGSAYDSDTHQKPVVSRSFQVMFPSPDRSYRESSLAKGICQRRIPNKSHSNRR